jgi:hypothetical protein
VSRDGPWLQGRPQNVPATRSLALEANGCFMVWVQPDPTEYKVAARGFARQAGFPRFVLVQLGCNQRAATRESEAKIPGRAKAGAVLAAVNTAPRRLRRWPSASVDRRCAPRALVFGRGEETAASTEQRNTRKGGRGDEISLTSKGPIQGPSATSCRMILLMLDFTISASGRTNRCPEKSGAAQSRQAGRRRPCSARC